MLQLQSSPDTTALVIVAVTVALQLSEYPVIADAELNIASAVDDWRNATGTPEYILGGTTSLQLVPAPDAGGTLTLKVALKPSPSATGIDDDIFNEYREAIVHGALARMMLSPKKPYSSPQLAPYHAQQFEIKAGQAGVRQARNYSRAPLQTAILRLG